MNETSLTEQELGEIAQARASFCALLNVHFTTLPDLEFVQRIRSAEFTSVLEHLVKDQTLHLDVTTGASLMRNYLQSTMEKDAAQLSNDLGVDRTRLYRGVSPGYGPPPPLEAVWSKDAGQVTAVLQKLASIYREAGMAVSPDARERQDYIGVELEYVQQLAQQEMAAWKSGDKEQAKNLVKKQGAFLAEHLGAWAPAFIEKALTMAETDFYRGHLLMLRGFLADELERMQVLLEELETTD